MLEPFSGIKLDVDRQDIIIYGFEYHFLFLLLIIFLIKITTITIPIPDPSNNWNGSYSDENSFVK